MVLLENQQLQVSLMNWIAKRSNRCYFKENINSFSSTVQTLLIKVMTQHFSCLITTKESKDVLYAYIKSIKTNLLVKLLKGINMIEVSLSSSYYSLIEVFDQIRLLCNRDVNETILSCFNTNEIWEQLVTNRQGKYVAEYFMTTYFRNEPFKLKLLFELIEVNFLEYSQLNFTTFLVQCYIETYQSSAIVGKILKSMTRLTSCRNGVFVLVCALKTYKDDALYLLIDRVIELADVLSKNTYASTAIEYLFKNHTEYSTKKFVQQMSSSFLGKLNFILYQIRNNRRSLWKLYHTEASKFSEGRIEA